MLISGQNRRVVFQWLPFRDYLTILPSSSPVISLRVFLVKKYSQVAFIISKVWLWFSAPLRFHLVHYEVPVRLSRFWKSPNSIGSENENRALPIHLSKYVCKFIRLLEREGRKFLESRIWIYSTRQTRTMSIPASILEEIGRPVRVPVRERVVSERKFGFAERPPRHRPDLYSIGHCVRQQAAHAVSNRELEPM